MGDDEASPSGAVKITVSDDTVEAEDLENEEAQEVEELEEPKEEADGWAEEAESMAGEEEEDEEEADSLEGEEEGADEKEGSNEDEDHDEGEEDNEEDIGVATLVVGTAKTEEELEQEAAEREAQGETEGEDYEDEYPEVSDDEPLLDQRMPMPAFLLSEEGDIDKRVAFALAAVLILLLSGSIIYIIVNKPLTITIPDERMGDEVTYQVNGDLKFDYDDVIAVPGVDLNISGADLKLKGEMKMGTRDVNGSVIDGFHNARATFMRYTEQDLNDIDGDLLIDDEWDELPGILKIFSSSKDYIDDGSHASIKTVTSNDINLRILGETSGSSQEVITYVQTPPADFIELYRQLVDSNKVTEGDAGTAWKAEKGEEILGYETLAITTDRQFTETDLDLPSILDAFLPPFKLHLIVKLWISEGTAYPLKYMIKADIEKPQIPDNIKSVGDYDIPDWLYPKLMGEMTYTAKATKITKGTTIIANIDPIITSDQKHKLAKSEGQFKSWSPDRAPQLGEWDLLKTGFDETFDLQTAIEVAKNYTIGNDLDEYLDDHASDKPFVVWARYNGSSEPGPSFGNSWNFTMGYYDKGKDLNDEVEAHQDVVNRTTGDPRFVHGENTEVRNPDQSMQDLKNPLTLRGMELVLANNEHTQEWVFNAQGNYDYTESQVTISEVVGTPNIDYIAIFEAIEAGTLNEIVDEVISDQRSYGYHLDKEVEDTYYRARVDAKSGELTYIFTLTTHNDIQN